jgi:hypothetical protein
MAAAEDSTALPPVMDEALVDVGPRTAEHTRIHLVPRDEGPAVDTRDQNAAVGRSQPFIGNRENDPAREASQQGGRNKVVAGEMNLASEFGESLQPPVQPLSAGPPCMGRSLSRRICRRCGCARCSKDWAVASGGRRPRRTLYPVGSHRAGPSSRIQRGHRPRWTGPIFLTVDQPKGGSVTRPSWSIGKRCCRAPISSLTPASRHLPAQCRWPDSATGRRSACAPVPPP